MPVNVNVDGSKDVWLILAKVVGGCIKTLSDGVGSPFVD
jgi:hypothetical protein